MAPSGVKSVVPPSAAYNPELKNASPNDSLDPANNSAEQSKTGMSLGALSAPTASESSGSVRKGTLPPDPSDIDYDPPLIQCLAALFRLHGKPVSTRLLVAGLAHHDGELSPSACLRSARNAGLNCKTVYRPQLSGISKFTLPHFIAKRRASLCFN